MDDQETKIQMARVTKYRELEKIRDEIHSAINAIIEGHKDGPHGQGPFTSNTRESRQIQSMKINFTATRVGWHPVEIYISGLHIEAWEFGKALENMLRLKLKPILEAMDKL